MTMNFLDPRLPERFWSKCIPEPNSGCWLWLGGEANGYGRTALDGVRVYVHRAVMMVERDIPNGMHIDHLCRNTLCCNPAHLEAVTQRENTLRGIGPFAIKARQSTCVHGHPFDEINTYTRKGRPGTRECKSCVRERKLAKGTYGRSK